MSALLPVLLAALMAPGCGDVAPFWYRDAQGIVSTFVTPVLLAAGLIAAAWLKRGADRRAAERDLADKKKAEAAAENAEKLLKAQEATQAIAAMAAQAQILAANRAAEKVAQVAENLAITQTATDAKLDAVKTVADKTHALTNNAMGVLLRAHAVALRAIAVQSKEHADIRAAEDAELRSREHDAGQSKLDEAVALSSALSPEKSP